MVRLLEAGKDYTYYDGVYTLQENLAQRTGFKPIRPYYGRFFSLEEDGLLTLKQGHPSNGATMALDTDTIIRGGGSAFHDAACQLYVMGYITHADRVGANHLLRDNMAATCKLLRPTDNFFIHKLRLLETHVLVPAGVWIGTPREDGRRVKPSDKKRIRR